MSQRLAMIIQEILELSVPLVVFLSTIIAGFIIREVVFSQLIRFSKKTRNQVDDIIIQALRRPMIIWFLMLGIYFGLLFSNFSKDTAQIINRLLVVLGIFSVTMAAANIISRLITVFSGRAGSALPVTSLTQNISRLIIFSVGTLVILNTLGISIAPILATLGVGGLAVALALQDTLANLFSGFYISLAKHVRPGDFLKLESGEEGYVEDIGWRATKIRMLPNNIVLIPNSKLSQSVITNYYLPAKEMAVLVQVGVHYNSDLKKVEKVTCEVGKEIMKEVSGGVPDFDPFIRYHTFADFSINFTVILRAKEFVDNYLIKHEFIKRLHERYNKEGIIIPYPIRAINNTQEKA